MEMGDVFMSLNVRWNQSAGEIERESFAVIDAVATKHGFDDREWRVARRIIHTTGDFSIIDNLRLRHDPVSAGIYAVRFGARIFCDSNMIRSGLSVARLAKLCPSYDKERIICHIADPDVAAEALTRGTTRALCSVEKARSGLSGAIVLVGNAPLALARVVRFIVEDGIRPALIIGVPVGFVNVVESKEMLDGIDVPHITILGRRGGSAIAVAVLHAILESAEFA